MVKVEAVMGARLSALVVLRGIRVEKPGGGVSSLPGSMSEM